MWAKNTSGSMGAASQHLPGSLQRSTLSLKMNTACEDWGDCQARKAKNTVTLPFKPLGWLYCFMTMEGKSHYPIASNFCTPVLTVSSTFLKAECRLSLDLDLSAALDTANHKILPETLFPVASGMPLGSQPFLSRFCFFSSSSPGLFPWSSS